MKINERNLFQAGLHALTISLCKKECKQVWKKVLRKTVPIRDGEKGLKQVADVQCSALLYP